MQRHDDWMHCREQAIANHKASGSTEPLPAWLLEPPPPRPQPFEDEAMADVSVDMTANGFDASESFTLDRSLADDIVPVADPGIESRSVRPISTLSTVKRKLNLYVAHEPNRAGRFGHSQQFPGESECGNRRPAHATEIGAAHRPRRHAGSAGGSIAFPSRGCVC